MDAQIGAVFPDGGALTSQRLEVVDQQLAGLFDVEPSLDGRPQLLVDHALKLALGLSPGQARPRAGSPLGPDLAVDLSVAHPPAPIPALQTAGVFDNVELTRAVRALGHRTILPVEPLWFEASLLGVPQTAEDLRSFSLSEEHVVGVRHPQPFRSQPAMPRSPRDGSVGSGRVSQWGSGQLVTVRRPRLAGRRAAPPPDQPSTVVCQKSRSELTDRPQQWAAQRRAAIWVVLAPQASVTNL